MACEPLALGGGTEPLAWTLEQNVPNPFNPFTTVSFEIAGPCDVRVAVYSPSGRFVRELVDGPHGPGRYSAVWDGDRFGRRGRRQRCVLLCARGRRAADRAEDGAPQVNGSPPNRSPGGPWASPDGLPPQRTAAPSGPPSKDGSDWIVRRSLSCLAAVAVLVARGRSRRNHRPTVFVSPGTTLVAPGESFTMDIRVDGGTDTVTCFLVEFEFDPVVIQLVSADEGSLFAACGFPTMCNWDVLGAGPPLLQRRHPRAVRVHDRSRRARQSLVRRGSGSVRPRSRSWPWTSETTGGTGSCPCGRETRWCPSRLRPGWEKATAGRGGSPPPPARTRSEAPSRLKFCARMSRPAAARRMEGGARCPGAPLSAPCTTRPGGW